MSKTVNKTMIGVFVIVAVAVVIAAVMVLGSGKLFRENPKFVMYFQGSVKGLSVGSPVVFRGVKVGTVTDIGMLFNEKDLSVLIPVYVELGQADVEMVGGTPLSGRKGERKKILYQYLSALIKRGIRAQLEMQSFVTGQLQIALDFFPDKPARFIGATTKYPEIPTIPTQLQELTQRVEKIPIEEIAEKMRSTLDGIDRVVNSPEMTGMMTSISKTADQTRTMVTSMERQIGPLSASIAKTSDEAAVTLKKVQGVALNIENTTGEDSPVVYRLNKTLDELERAARSLRFLAETLEEQPESLIFGKKSTKRGTQ